MSTDVMGADLPLWAQVLVAALVLAGALIALLGSLGLVRLKSYFERVHAPSIIATMGCWLIMHATWIYFSVSGQGFVMHSVLIAIFIAVTVPITTIFLMRAALFRGRRAGESVPLTLSNLVRNEPQEASEMAEGAKPAETPDGAASEGTVKA
ncbi:monovalent cation/H(+) antiporter subunit G [Comamonas sp.]|uniref:monovalent cation/H(+) antiporter subunit G n=1 Tax=Comamonas sp. TaxID=34028 RepID=UPI003A944218